MAGTHYTNQYLSRRPMVLGLAKVLFLSLGQLSFVQAAPLHAAQLWSQEKKGKPASDPNLWLYLGISVVLVLAGGAFAGLTIALMGQDEIYLQVIRDSGEGKEVKHAAKVLDLLKKGKHWVLVTLLLSNVITNETLPIVLDRSLGGGWPAVLSSTVLIVIFGEIVPQSICVRYGLPIGAFMSPAVLLLMYLMAPVAWPTAKLLDFLLGEDHGTMYKKAGLKTLVSLHRNLGESGQRLHADEVTIISAVLDLKEKSIGSIMTPMDDVFTLSLDDVLDEPTMDDILSQGYSRIPVHHPDNDENFVGMLLVKMLITYDPEDAKPVRDFALATLPETSAHTSCLDIVNFFQEGKSHMVLVSEHPGEDRGALGVVTLEDVIEELIGEEIIDESDVFVDVHKAIRRMAPAPRSKFPKVTFTGATPKASAADLIDIAEDEPLKTNDLPRRNTGDEGIKTDGRRASGVSVNGVPRVSNKTNKDEVLEHLKHLGPSNLASRPKTTRFASVKIKPGSESADNILQKSISRDGERQAPTRRISESASDYAGGIGEGLVPSGGKLASDGVQALAIGYGAISTSPQERRPQSANKGIQADLIERDHSPPKEREHLLRPTASSARSHDTINELPETPRSRSPLYKSRGPARSGSITENIIDTNGIRKVVLETTSSSESGDENGTANQNKQQSQSNSQENSNPSGHGGEENVTSDHATTSKKKRRRKRHNKHSKDESEPLLGSK